VLIELDPVDRLTAGAVGQPGARVFYLQARKDDRLVTLLVEKQQVQLLAASVVEILARVGKETGQGPPEEEMGLEEPAVPEWRAGRLSIGYQEERDLLVLEAEEILPEEEVEGEEGDEEDGQEGGEALKEQLAMLEAGLGSELELELATEELEAELGADLGSELEQKRGVDPEDPAEVGDSEAEPQRARFWGTREQMLSLARQGAAVCAAGRPRCQLCGNPMDPEGHRCPALNGHLEQSSG
jgi:uncharacterized repeat protein (TIGR03847 family)